MNFEANFNNINCLNINTKLISFSLRNVFLKCHIINGIKVKVKFNLEQATKFPRGELRYNSTLSLTSALDGSGWSTPRPGGFIPGKETVPIVGPRAGLDGCGKSRPPPGFDPLTVKPVASRYTY
jgi:hypothetical protein